MLPSKKTCFYIHENLYLKTGVQDFFATLPCSKANIHKCHNIINVKTPNLKCEVHNALGYILVHRTTKQIITWNKSL